MSLTDAQLERFSRHILLPEFDIAGQQKMCDARVAIVGLGGLGSPVSLYLAAAGVGELILIDADTVELSNLQRQIVHPYEGIGLPKVESARDSVQRLAPECHVVSHCEQIAASNVDTLLKTADMVVDCCDNFATRFLLNDFCVKNRLPLVSGAAIRMEGQVSVFDLREPCNPCYRCLYTDTDAMDDELRCADNGVLAPVVGIVGSIQATEVLKLLADVSGTLTGYLLQIDALRMDWRKLALPKDPACPVCS